MIPRSPGSTSTLVDPRPKRPWGESRVDVVAMVIRQKLRLLGRFPGDSFTFPGFVPLYPGDGHGFRVSGKLSL